MTPPALQVLALECPADGLGLLAALFCEHEKDDRYEVLLVSDCSLQLLLLESLMQLSKVHEVEPDWEEGLLCRLDWPQLTAL